MLQFTGQLFVLSLESLHSLSLSHQLFLSLPLSLPPPFVFFFGEVGEGEGVRGSMGVFVRFFHIVFVCVNEEREEERE